ncbi:pimeloyl-ACP methyl ester carboxylesterase [Kribbella aluminosa]|uniref:Pimeloyl-ACP methyl ester carboxylesterase n=1 Tax=Kribbella aluminosa TaxID=416017 RepID=A0ABS4UVC8_9ACTN|nr:alpha/beta hydrolase [Kribbella aluminosa]MBP2355593.1 pimeloyl-ACP methyl ester carboxylesterase [Kribbella aluminosa]
MTIQLERSGVTTSDGVRLNVEVTGPADAPVTVLLVHGWTCSTRSWHNQVEGLPQILGPDAVRVVTYDHRGHGRSDAAPPGSTRLDQLADDLVTVLDEVVGDGPVVYAGHSMGGMTLMAAADRYPELFGTRIRAAALISTTSGHLTEGALGIPARLDPTAARIAPRVLNAVGRRIDRRAAARAAAGSRGSEAAGELHQATALVDGGRQAATGTGAARSGQESAGRRDRVPAAGSVARLAGVGRRAAVRAARLQGPVLRRVVFGKKADPAEVELFMEDLAVVPGASYGGFFETMLEHDRGDALKVLEQLPVEIMHGTCDRLLPPRHANRMAAQLPTARLWIYPGAGHMLMQERPRDITHRLASLVRKAST